MVQRNVHIVPQDANGIDIISAILQVYAMALSPLLYLFISN